MLRAAAEQRDEEGPGRLRRVEEAQDRHRSAEHVEHERRVERDGDPEDHRDQVDVERALEDLLPPEEPKALTDRRPPDREPFRRRRRRTHPRQREDHAEGARGVQEVRPSHPVLVDQQAGEDRAGDRGRLVIHDLEGERGCEEIGREQPGGPCAERRRVERVRRGPHEREREQDPHLRVRAESVHGQRDREDGDRPLRDHEESPALDRVGDRAAHDRKDDQRQHLGEGEETDHRGRPRDVVDLERDRDERDLRPELRDRLPDEEAAEVGGDLERREVDPVAAESPEPAGVPGLRRHRRRKLVVLVVREPAVVAHAAGRYRMRRDRRRSARTFPPVWQSGQYVTSWDS